MFTTSSAYAYHVLSTLAAYAYHVLSALSATKFCAYMLFCWVMLCSLNLIPECAQPCKILFITLRSQSQLVKSGLSCIVQTFSGSLLRISTRFESKVCCFPKLISPNEVQINFLTGCNPPPYSSSSHGI